MPTAPRFADVLAPAAHEAEVLSWRRARLRRLTAPDGFLSLVGRAPLHAGDNTIGADPASDVVVGSDQAPARMGVLRVGSGGVDFVPEPGVEARLRVGADGTPRAVTGPLRLEADDRLLFGRLRLQLAEQDGVVTVRVRDPQSPRLLGFTGLEHFPIRAELRVVARLLPHATPRRVELDYDTGRVESYQSPGMAVFTLDGAEQRVELLIDTGGNRLFVPFRDRTSPAESYGAGRFLYAPLPDGERVLLDWNQAFNPPCAFTPYAFCPLTPRQNDLAVRIEAGERKPREPEELPR